MSSRSIVPAAALLSLLLLPSFFSPTASAREKAPPPKPTQEWDQTAVTTLAKQLAQAAAALYGAYYEDPGSSGLPGSGNSMDAYQLEYKLRTLRELTEGLAAELAHGKGRGQTTPQYQDIGETLRDTTVLLGYGLDEGATQTHVAAVRDAWRQMNPYYGIPEPTHP